MGTTLSEANKESEIRRAYNENSCCTFSDNQPPQEFIAGYKKGQLKAMDRKQTKRSDLKMEGHKCLCCGRLSPFGVKFCPDCGQRIENGEV